MPKKYLIITADDFGLARSINEGIIKGYRAGIITHLNLMPTGEAFDHAVSLMKKYSLVEVGAHLALTGVTPVSQPINIATLINQGKYFPENYQYLFGKLCLKRINLGQVYYELKNQLKKIQKSGIKITNLNSHEHIHLLPQLIPIFMKLAREFNIPTIRCLRENISYHNFTFNNFCRYAIFSVVSRRARKIIRSSDLLTTDYCFGLLDSGRLDQLKLVRMLSSLPAGTTEIITHPGLLDKRILAEHPWHKNCAKELMALTSTVIKRLLREEKIKPVSFLGLLKMRVRFFSSR